MALSPQRLQQKRAKKAALRRKAHAPAHVHGSPSASINTGRNWENGLSSPIHEVFVNENIFAGGMGTLVYCRRTADMQHIVSMFLLDTYCLGVKNVVQSVMSAEQFAVLKMQLERSHNSGFIPMPPPKARKLLEELVAWSRNLGFEPAADYGDAVRILNDTPLDDSSLAFEFGAQGKPFYIAGPRDSLAKSKRIIDQLAKKCGEGGFEYMISPTGGF
ncbi:hypothetical protein [Propionivibrio sp.]|uniref:hypothetical protein n=1 Tax=Propionivibrio sp. TaxID=2212460 RepID=UPI003BF2C537